LKEYGWRPDLSRSAKRNVNWGYNHSDAYIDTVLWLANEVESPTPAPVRVASRKKSVRSKKRAPVVRKATAKRTSHARSNKKKK
jgi:hypothetical protein